MKRMILILVPLLLITLCLQASYKMYLVSGQVITADAKPEIRDGMAYFSKGGLHCYMPVSQVDMEKSENPPSVLDPHGEAKKSAAPKQAVRKISDEKLNDAIKDSKLANEGELAPPAYLDEPSPTEGDVAPAGAVQPAGEQQEGGGQDPQMKEMRQARQAVMQRLKEASDELNRATKERDELVARLANLRDQFDTNVQQADKERLDAEMQSVRDQIGASSARVSDMRTRVANAQEVLNSLPIVYEAGGGGGEKK